MKKSKDISNPPYPVTLRLYFAAFVACVGGFCVAGSNTYSNQALPSLEKDGRFGLTRNSQEESCFGSFTTLGSLFGALIGGVLGGKLGRKRAMHVATIPAITGWILICLSHNLIMLYIGRTLIGVSTGAFCVLMAAYISEISTPDIRGRLLSGPVLFSMVSALLSFGFGVFLNWIYLAIFLGLQPIIFAVLLFFIPESPYSLVLQERPSDARRALLWLRGKDYVHIDDEMDEIVRTVFANQQTSKVSILDLFQPQTLKPLLIAIIIQLIQQGSGFNAVVCYSTEMFESAGSSLNPAVATLYVGIVATLSSLFGLIFADKMGRKPWLVISGSVMAASFLTLGTYCKLTDAGIIRNGKLGWIPAACMWAYVAGANVGYINLAYIVTAEILVCTETRSLAIGLTGALNNVFSFTGAITYPMMVTRWKPCGTFWFYGGFALIGVVFPPLFMFETRGKSLEEIQKHYMKIKDNPPTN